MSDELPKATCGDCGKRRTGEKDYHPVQVVLGQPLGWYSNSDGEMCTECFTRMMERANR